MNNKNPIHSNSRNNKLLTVSFSSSPNTLAPPINNSNSSNSSTPHNTTKSPLPFASQAPMAYHYEGILRQHHTTSNPSTSAATRLQPPFSSANLLNFGSDIR